MVLEQEGSGLVGETGEDEDYAMCYGQIIKGLGLSAA